MKGETYEQFVEKFKPKKTTDDCYTPPLIYDGVADWVCTEYGINRDAFADHSIQAAIMKRLTIQVKS